MVEPPTAPAAHRGSSEKDTAHLLQIQQTCNLLMQGHAELLFTPLCRQDSGPVSLESQESPCNSHTPDGLGRPSPSAEPRNAFNSISHIAMLDAIYGTASRVYDSGLIQPGDPSPLPTPAGFHALLQCLEMFYGCLVTCLAILQFWGRDGPCRPAQSGWPLVALDPSDWHMDILLGFHLTGGGNGWWCIHHSPWAFHCDR